MSQKLCEKCENYIKERNLIIFPWDHCHHDTDEVVWVVMGDNEYIHTIPSGNEEKKGCEYCNSGADTIYRLKNAVYLAKYCPECGKKI